MADWITPKTDWASSDAFNIEDYNRIRNNLTCLHELAETITLPFSIEDMGEDYEEETDEDKMWDVSIFNAIEDNLDTINEHTFNFDFGLKTTFYANGVFIRYTELNRIESASLQMYEAIVNHVKTIPVLPFVLGQYRLLRA